MPGSRLRVVVVSFVEIVLGGLIDGPWGLAGAAFAVMARPWLSSGSRRPDRLAQALSEWAAGQDPPISQATLKVAFRRTSDILALYGVTPEQMTAANLDAARIAGEVTTAARARLDEIAEDELRRTCEQIIRTFYTQFLASPEFGAELALAGVKELLTRIPSDQIASDAERWGLRLLLREDLTRYLTRLIQYVSNDPWHHEQGTRLTPADLERVLRVRITTSTASIMSAAAASGTGNENAMTRDELADSIIDSSARLVVLAGPGAGKTWLTRRAARRAAERALRDLASGMDLDQIEIPVLLTCTAFLISPGDARTAAVSPAVDAVGDLGPHAGERLKRFLRERDHGILLILDSFDESPPPLQWQRPVEHALIGGWRTMLTSRHSAWTHQWDTTRSGPPASPEHDGQHVVTAELRDLTYPDDVEPFIRTWFTPERSSSADTLIRHLRTNQAAREFSTIPLFLTFLCLVMDIPGGALPSTRSDLVDEVIAWLLGAGWRRADPAAPVDSLIETVRGWAWTAALDDPVNGLSAWTDNIATPLISIPGRERLDAVGVPTSQPSQGRHRHTRRRFIHRVLREYLVATHVAAMPTHDAHEQILAHWWFDDTWAEIIPTAIAKHHDRDALLDGLISAVTLNVPPRVQGVLAVQTTQTLLRVCNESQPTDWNEQTRTGLNDLRARQAAAQPDLLTQSAHWHESNLAAVAALAAYLPDAGHRTEAVARALVDLDPTEATRATAVIALAAHLHVGDWSVNVAQALVDLATTEAARAAAVTALAAHLPDTGIQTEAVARALVDLATTEATRAAAIAALAARLPEAGGWTVAVARALVDLDPTEAARAAAVAALAAHLRDASIETEAVARALVDLDPTEAARAAAIAALAARLPDAVFQTEAVVRALVDLDPTEATRAAAIAALAAHLPEAGGWTEAVARALVDLDPTEAARAAAVAALAAHLPDASIETEAVARALVDLDPTEAARAAAIAALAAHLPDAGYQTEAVARALVDLDPTEAARAAAIAALAAHLPEAGGWTEAVARALVDLDPTEAARAAAIAALAARLPEAGGWTVAVARALVDLDPTEAARAAAVAALAAHLRDASIETEAVARALVDLDPTEAARAAAVAALAAHLPDASYHTPAVARALVDLATTKATRAAAVAALAAHLPDAGYQTEAVARALVDLDPTEAARAAAVAALAAHLPGYQTEAVARALVDLATTKATRAAAVTALAAHLPDADRSTGDVARALRGCCAASDWMAQLESRRRA